MIVPDVNLLVFAYNVRAPLHDPARLWWNGLLNGDEPVGVPWAVSTGFVRIITNPRAVTAPLSPLDAVSRIRDWFLNPHVVPLNPGAGHLSHFQRYLASAGGSNLVPDAHIAALAMEHDAELHSHDSDFARFPGLSWRNPLR